MKEKYVREFHLRITDEEYDRLQALAVANGLTASGTIRYMIRFCSLPIIPSDVDMKNESEREFEH